MSIDSALSDVGDCIGDCLSFSFGKTIKSVADKAKTGAAMTPQGQAVSAASGAMSKSSSAPKSSSVPKSSGGFMSKITGGGSKAVGGGMFNRLSQRKLYGVPVLFVVAGLGFFGFLRLRKAKKI